MKRKPDKASVHNGRANAKGMAYNPNHNTLEQSRVNQPHIDQERIHLNQYLQYMGDGTAIGHRGGGGGYDSRKHELERYRQLYGKGLEARNQRYRASGHRERVKTMSQVYRDPKTAPMETIFQLGNKRSETDEQTRTQVMVGAWGDVLQHLRQQYGANLIPLDASLHREETTDHIHFRFALGAKDKFGHFIEKIELYPREGRKLSGQWIKTIHFKFPMYYNDNNEASCAVCFDLNGNFLPKKSNDESIVTLSR